MPSIEEVQTLTRLGLTTRQAKVYIALAKSGPSTAKTISKSSKVTREEIYRVIPTLQEWGLVKKIIDSPIRFTAISIQEGVSIFMTRKIEELDDLQIKSKKLIHEFKSGKVEATFLSDSPEFILIPKNLASIKMRKRAIETAQVSINVIVTLNRYNRFMSNHFKLVQNALERGVKIRFIVEKPETENLSAEIEKHMKYPCFKFRYIINRPSAQVTIYDNKAALITTNPKANLVESSSLWTSNPSLLSIVNNYFESIWSKAAKNQCDNLK